MVCTIILRAESISSVIRGTEFEEKQRVVHRILDSRYWIVKNNIGANIIAQQEIYNGKQITKFTDFTNDGTLKVTDAVKNRKIWYKLSGVMYTAIGCKLGDILKHLFGKATKVTIVNAPIDEINNTVLKIISVLLEMTSIVPNLIYQEPGGFMTVALSLNIYLNRLIRVKKEPIRLGKFNVRRADHVYKRIIAAQLNTIERFTIINCSLDDYNSGGNEDEENISNENKRKEIINILGEVDNILYWTGCPTNGISDLSYSTHSPHAHFNVIIIQIIKKLRPIMNIDESLEDKIVKESNEISDILLYMDFILDSIMRIVYQSTLNILKIVEDYQKIGTEMHKKKLESTINIWTNINVTMIYDELSLLITSLNFSMSVVYHIDLLSRIVRNIIDLKDVYDLKLLKKQIEENLNAIYVKKYPAGLMLMSSINQYEINLHEFLIKILSIDEFNYFNRLLKLLQPYHNVKYNDMFETKLNEMKYSVVYSTSSKVEGFCKSITLMYVDFYTIHTKIKECHKNKSCLQQFIGIFSGILDTFMDMWRVIKNSENYENDNHKIIISYAIQFLRNNLSNYVAEDGGEKLQRIEYLITNLFDKYIIYNCINPLTRSDLHQSYKQTKTYSSNRKILEIKSETDSNIPVLSSTNKKSTKKKNLRGLLQKRNRKDEKSNEGVRPVVVSPEKLIIMSIDGYVKEMSETAESFFFFWKGNKMTIIEIFDDINEKNMFHLSFFVNYKSIFHKWIVSSLFYDIIDFLRYFSRAKHYEELVHESFSIYLRNLRYIDFPDHYLPIINTIASVGNVYQQVDNISLRILLEQNLIENGAFLLLDSFNPKENSADYYLNKLDHIFNKLWKVFNVNPTLDWKIEQSFNSSLQDKFDKYPLWLTKKSPEISNKVKPWKNQNNFPKIPKFSS
ncbi:Hypothetical protein CINCED_3A013319 [Cinara cedri]|uniref:Uncharacterized protein n=1 Tax=Cinara cedri TaxID=506608 RepID=A0A5E4MU66_9HEMI|nr:Hypothetical protein CINCED_3A013319 [Cinara cedri]